MDTIRLQAIFKIKKSEFLAQATLDVGVDHPQERQGLASDVFGTEIILAGGFIKQEKVMKFGKSPQINSSLISLDFQTMTSQLLDSSDDGKSAQATLEILDSKAVALIGGSMEALKIFTTKPMSEEKPCIFA